MQANTFCFDGDAALALEVHGVKHLFVHFALRERAGHFEETVGKRGLAVVDVRDDAEISNELGVHFFSLTNVLDCGQDSNGAPACAPVWSETQICGVRGGVRLAPDGAASCGYATGLRLTSRRSTSTVTGISEHLTETVVADTRSGLQYTTHWSTLRFLMD